MKKVISLSMVCLMALSIWAVISCTEKDEPKQNESGSGNNGYVDLGLPSGTKWKNHNEMNAADAEHGFYTFDEAVEAFGSQLPTRVQQTELMSLCKWTWTDSGYTVKGLNNNTIFLPASGYRLCEGNVNGENIYGLYWSSTPFREGPYSAWYLQFFYYPDNRAHVDTVCYRRCQAQSVRLVQN